jgi:lipid A disaccharide synthetase
MRRRVVPEFLQGACTARNLADAVRRPPKNFARDAAELRKALSVRGDPSDLAARAVLSIK